MLTQAPRTSCTGGDEYSWTRGVRRLLLGSVTDRVIRSCEDPVLVVPCS